ncbi:MAG TPA: FAD-binding oxidoreductase [Candidatus Polarisedimenticolaceae bacterium]|nr:FAD-binding oxidoreductase [Candidatus Polarisedimenticolaceae bacterium]
MVSLRTARWAAAALAIAVALVVGPPAVFLFGVWWKDPLDPLPPTAPGRGDASGLVSALPAEVVPVAADLEEAQRQVAALVTRAASQGRHVVIAGSRHSMGGHTVLPEAIVLDMRPFRSVTVDAERRIAHVGAGATWAQVIPALDAFGLSVAQMQSNNDFTVGGSISVNAHGWAFRSPPIAASIEAFRIVTADGQVIRCSRTENAELFSLALGGYGLFGVILDVELRVVPNEMYTVAARRVRPQDYERTYDALTAGRDDLGMAYGRLSVAPASFLREGRIVLFARGPQAPDARETLSDVKRRWLKRLVFRGAVGSDYGKNLRWALEKLVGEQGGGPVSRNRVLDEPSSWFTNRDPESTEVLQEYFVPPEGFALFVEGAREILLRHRPDLLNVTVREVAEDQDTMLRYARGRMFALVFLVHQKRNALSDAATGAWERELIDLALRCGGTYYLPYRLHARREQFLRAYPTAPDFFAAKRRYDPGEVFSNSFYRTYGPTDNGRTEDPR